MTSGTEPGGRDPKQLADSLVRLLTDQPTVTSVLAVAVRAALFECAEEEQVARQYLTRTNHPISRALMAGRIETANRVVHRISDALGQLATTPAEERTFDELVALGQEMPTGPEPKLKLSELKTADQVLREQLQDPEFRQEWERRDTG